MNLTKAFQPARESAFSDAGLSRVVAQPKHGADAPWQRDMLEIFLRNQMKLAATLPLAALLLSLAAAAWANWTSIVPWTLGAFAASFIQYVLCRLYFSGRRQKYTVDEWINIIATSELFQGAVWASSLYAFWPGAHGPQGAFMVVALTAVVALRFLIVNNFMPVLLAGTGVMTLGAAIRCAMVLDATYLTLALILLTLEFLFLLVSQQLHDSVRDSLIARREKDKLIEDLSAARGLAEDQRQKAEMASRAKSVFLANMSHELRTPLNAILGFSEILDREMFGPITNPTYKDYAHDIHTSGNYLLGLINDVLDISRIEAGRRELDEEPVEISAIVAHVANLAGLSAATKGIMLSTDVAADLPKLFADKRAVQQVCVNILANAVKFTPKSGSVVMGAKRLSDGRLQIFVRDTGAGMAPDEVEGVLQAFNRGRDATRKAVEGTGLGLSIVNGIMQLHGGSVAVDSALGKGTVVTCTFPARRAYSGTRALLQEQAAKASETQQRLIRLTG